MKQIQTLQHDQEAPKYRYYIDVVLTAAVEGLLQTGNRPTKLVPYLRFLNEYIGSGVRIIDAVPRLNSNQYKKEVFDDIPALLRYYRVPKEISLPVTSVMGKYLSDLIVKSYRGERIEPFEYIKAIYSDKPQILYNFAVAQAHYEVYRGNQRPKASQQYMYVPIHNRLASGTLLTWEEMQELLKGLKWSDVSDKKIETFEGCQTIQTLEHVWDFSNVPKSWPHKQFKKLKLADLYELPVLIMACDYCHVIGTRPTSESGPVVHEFMAQDISWEQIHYSYYKHKNSQHVAHTSLGRLLDAYGLPKIEVSKQHNRYFDLCDQMRAATYERLDIKDKIEELEHQIKLLEAKKHELQSQMAAGAVKTLHQELRVAYQIEKAKKTQEWRERQPPEIKKNLQEPKPPKKKVILHPKIKSLSPEKQTLYTQFNAYAVIYSLELLVGNQKARQNYLARVGVETNILRETISEQYTEIHNFFNDEPDYKNEFLAALKKRVSYDKFISTHEDFNELMNENPELKELIETRVPQ